MKANISVRGYAMILISAFLFGSYGVWSKILGDDFGIYYQGWVRSAIVLAVLIPWMFLSKQYRPIKKGDWKWILICVLFGVFTQAPLYYAFNHSSIGTATLIFYAMYVITSYIIGRLFLGEKITGIKLVAMLLALTGLVLTFGLSLEKFAFIALLLAAINGVASGGEVSTTKKSTDKYSSLMIGNAVWLGILITHLPMSLITHEKQITPAFDTQWLAMLVFAGAGLAAFWLVIEGFKFVDASIGSLIGLLEIVFGVLFGIVFFDEILSATVVFGGLLIILAAMLPDLKNIIEHRHTQLPEDPIREI
jgi:drug/metabolite transporter (DMT)-like permease